MEPTLPRSSFAVRLVSAAIGLIFIAAAVSKLLGMREFAEVLYKANVLPQQWVTGLVILVPAVELALGWLLIIGIAPRVALLGTALLLGMFTSYVAVLLWKYTVPPNCGCMGQFELLVSAGRPAAILALARNVLLIGAVAYAWWSLSRAKLRTSVAEAQ